MKKLILLSIITLSLFACNKNPNKEARIQQLETKVDETLKKVEELEIKILSLENANQLLETRLGELENTSMIERI